MLGGTWHSEQGNRRKILATIEKAQTHDSCNIFTVSPDKQIELTDLPVRATEETARHLPGFISASIHRGLEGTKVVNYAQLRSQADFAVLQNNPAARPQMQAAAARASFEPIVCEVVDSIAADK